MGQGRVENSIITKNKIGKVGMYVHYIFTLQSRVGPSKKA